MLAGRSVHDHKFADDGTLMVLVAQRDAFAFRELIDRHAEAARHIAYRMTGDAVDAEDVAQDAMLRLWRDAAGWRPAGGGVGGWLRRVTMNLCFDRLRRRRFASDGPVPEQIDPAPRADQAIDAVRIRDAVVQCIGGLAERQRAAIVLTYYEDLSNIMAADALEMNVKAFESLLLRARRSLGEQLRAAGIVEAIEEGAPWPVAAT